MNCELSIGKVHSNGAEGDYFMVRIQNRTEKVNIEVKLNAEQFANLMTGQVIDDAILNDKSIKKHASIITPKGKIPIPK